MTTTEKPGRPRGRPPLEAPKSANQLNKECRARLRAAGGMVLPSHQIREKEFADKVRECIDIDFRGNKSAMIRAALELLIEARAPKSVSSGDSTSRG